MAELLKNFGIDWRLLLAQAVNFFVLLWVLKKFAYAPIIKALKKRKEEIQKGINFTKEAEEKLKNSEAVGQETIKKAHLDGLAIVTSAEKAAKAEQQKIIAQARIQSEAVLHDAKNIIEEEKAKMNQQVYKNAKELIREGVVNVLKQIPPTERDKNLIDAALNELKSNI